MRRVAFLGGDAFAVPALKALASRAGTDLVLVACPAERPSGRGMSVRQGPVPMAAEDLGLECARLANPDEAGEALEEAGADVCVVCAFGMKLDARSLAAPKFGCVNIHASLLPRWRGAAPVERAILAGDRETGVTIIRINERIDAGDMLLSGATGIGERETAGELRARLAGIGARLIVDALDGLETIRPVPQNESEATLARKIRKEEARLDICGDARELCRKVRAFNPRPGASLEVCGARLKVLGAEAADANGKPGTLADADGETVTVACGSGALRLVEVVPAGSKAMPAGAWMRGLRPQPAAGDAVAGELESRERASS